MKPDNLIFNSIDCTCFPIQVAGETMFYVLSIVFKKKIQPIYVTYKE